MPQIFSDQQLLAYLDETLSNQLMSEVEKHMRTDASLRERLTTLVGRREAGIHGLGEIWQRNRLSCPSRQQLGSFLLGALDEKLKGYFEFHIRRVGCRLCQANLEDLERQRTEQLAAAKLRQKRYFQSSAGYLSRHSQQGD